MGFESSAEYTVRYTIVATGERRTDTHLGRINAAAAYARGATGAGETILIMDSGIRSTHREFTEGISTKVTFETETGYNPGNMERYHGTAVTALAAGRKDGGAGMNGLNMHGVAFDADVYFREVNLSDPVPGYNPYELHLDGAAEDQEFADFISPLFSRPEGAVINFSFGRDGAISLYERGLVRNRLARTAAVLAQAGTPDADKKIVVWAAGNAGGRSDLNGVAARFDSPELLSGMSAYFPELQSHVLAVVALDQDGTIADYSNRCGIAKDFCLAAPGSDMLSTNTRNGNDQEYLLGSGTSFAAPMVSGSLALLRQYFRGQLGNTDVVNRLLATANRRGIYADSDIYGHGLVDLDAATRPSGGTLTTGLPGDPRSRPLGGSGIALAGGGGAFGASLQRALADVEIAGFDALGAPFFQSAAAAVTAARRVGGGGDEDGGGVTVLDSVAYQLRDAPLFASPWMNAGGYDGPKLSLTVDHDGEIRDARLALANGWWFSHGHHGGRRLGFSEGSVARRFSEPLAFAAPYLSLVRDGPGVGWSRSRGDGGGLGFALMHGTPQFDGWQKPGGERGFGALLDYRIYEGAGRAGLSLQAGAVREADGLLGARGQNAFGEIRGATVFAGVNGAWTPGGENHWRLLASAYAGSTRAQVGGNGFLRGADDILSSAFSLGATRASLWRRDDWLSLRLSQPLRVERGDLSLRVPAGRTPSGEVVHRDYAVNLAPTGRTLQAEAMYRLPIAGGALQTRLGVERHPQHDQKRDLAPFVKVTFERRF